MKILNAQEALLSQFEVYSHLKADPEFQQVRQMVMSSASHRPGRHHRHNKPLSVTLTNSQFALYETVEYLEKMPCSKYTPAQVQKFMERMMNVPITKSERLQLLDLCPRTPVDLYSLIEELEARFAEDDAIDNILNVIEETLCSPADQDAQQPEEVHDTDMAVEVEPSNDYINNNGE